MAKDGDSKQGLSTFRTQVYAQCYKHAMLKKFQNPCAILIQVFIFVIMLYWNNWGLHLYKLEGECHGEREGAYWVNGLSCSIVGRAPERTAEPPQEEAGPQGPRSMADEGVKGGMMVDSPPHQPQKRTVNIPVSRYRKHLQPCWLFNPLPLFLLGTRPVAIEP